MKQEEKSHKHSPYIQDECIRKAFQSLQTSLIGYCGGIAVIYILVYKASDFTSLTGWVAATFLIVLLRFFLMRSYQNSDLKSEKRKFWHHMFVAGAMAAGLILGFSGIILVANPIALEQFIILMILCSFIVAAASSLYTLPHAFFGFAFLAIGPTAYRMLLSSFEQSEFVAIILAVLIMYAGLSAIRQRNVLIKSLELQQNNDALVERLRLERDETKQLNQKLLDEIQVRQEFQQSLIDSQEKLVESKLAAENANKAKSDFLSKMSHELRTPLNAIIGYSNVMANKTFGEIGNKKYEDYPGIIHEAGEHLLNLVNNILDISKIETGKFKIDERIVSPNDLIQVTLSIANKLAAEKDIKVSLDLQAGLPNIKGDEFRLKQVLLNFLSNAIKFTPEKGEIMIGAFLDSHDEIVFFVNDTGIGMAKDDITSAMEPFSQISDNQTGTGLGLGISKKLVELHDGELRLTSSEENGTTIAFNLPKERMVPVFESGTRH